MINIFMLSCLSTAKILTKISGSFFTNSDPKGRKEQIKKITGTTIKKRSKV